MCILTLSLKSLKKGKFQPLVRKPDGYRFNGLTLSKSGLINGNFLGNYIHCWLNNVDVAVMQGEETNRHRLVSTSKSMYIKG